MDTKTQLGNALKDAMRAKDETRKSTLRMALTSIRLAEVDNRGPLDENAVLAVLQKEVKTRQESIVDAERAGRPDLVAAAEAEMEILKPFLPQQLSSDELEALAQEVINEVGATDMRQMGLVMKSLMPRLQGRATGDQASQAVRKLLQ